MPWLTSPPPTAFATVIIDIGIRNVTDFVGSPYRGGRPAPAARLRFFAAFLVARFFAICFFIKTLASPAGRHEAARIA
jgi:hypothetical protein